MSARQFPHSRHLNDHHGHLHFEGVDLGDQRRGDLVCALAKLRIEGRSMHRDGLLDRIEMAGDFFREAARVFRDTICRLLTMRP